METNNEAEPEKETVIENKTESKSVNATETKTESITASKPAVESTLQRLTPAVIVSISILLSSGIISATSFAKSKDMAPQVRNFYYQLPPPGPYMSTLEMPRPPFTKNTPYNNQARPNYYPQQMTPPGWARPMPHWNQPNQGQRPEAQQQSTTQNQDQKSASHQMMRPMAPPAWAQHPQQMKAPNWARPMPPWYQQPPGQQSGTNQKSGPNINSTKNHNADSQATKQLNTPPRWAQHPQQMVPPAWAQRPQPMPRPAWAQQRPQQMPPPNWARRPLPPWQQPAPRQQPGAKQNTESNPDLKQNLNQDQKSASQQAMQSTAPPMWSQHPQQMPPPAWVQRPPQMVPPGWARPTPPWVQQPKQDNK